MPEWDETKRLANLAKHGVEFCDLDGLTWSEALEFEDVRRDYGERSLIAMTPLGRRLHVVVYVERNGQLRYICARKANSREIAFYEKQMASPNPEEDRAIARAIAEDSDAAPDLSQPIPGIPRRSGRPPKPDAKVSVTLRLDRDIVERFKASGVGWQTRINAALRQAGGD